jgi:hypothetical protein
MGRGPSKSGGMNEHGSARDPQYDEQQRRIPRAECDSPSRNPIGTAAMSTIVCFLDRTLDHCGPLLVALPESETPAPSEGSARHTVIRCDRPHSVVVFP